MARFGEFLGHPPIGQVVPQPKLEANTNRMEVPMCRDLRRTSNCRRCLLFHVDIGCEIEPLLSRVTAIPSQRMPASTTTLTYVFFEH